MSVSGDKLPSDFLWGVATAAHQVEGLQHNNWSKWELFAADQLAASAEQRLKDEVPHWDAIKDEATDPENYISGTSDDHWNRYNEDFDIIKDLGCTAYRLSVEWSRIEPEPGRYDEDALSHYSDMAQALVDRGIEPMVTLHHFTDPVWLKKKGGWHGNEVVQRFGDMTDKVARKLGDKVTHWCSINEPDGYLNQQYKKGEFSINTSSSNGLVNEYKYLQNVIKAHKLARKTIQQVNPDAKVGIAYAMVDYQLGRRDPLSWAGKTWQQYMPNTYLLERVKNNTDFIGVNYYLRKTVKSQFKKFDQWDEMWNGSDQRNDLGWGIYPEGLYNVTQKLKKYDLPLIVTENGIPDADDSQRAEYIVDHVDAMKRSVADGADIRGYFHWSLLDNFEWSEGYWPKFGLVAVNRKTGERTVRASAEEYARIIRES